MRKARAAEWILSLVTSRERAASTVGDWLETAPHDSAWLLYAAMQTTLSMIWKGIAADRAKLAGVASVGLLVSVIAVVVAGVVTAVTTGVALGIAFAAGLGRTPPEWLLRGYILIVVVAIASEIGRWMARECPGREIAVCVTFVLIHTALNVIGYLLTGNSSFNVANVRFELVFDIPLLAGAIVTRVRSLRLA